MCSPCGPMVCYKYEDCGPPKGKTESISGAEESGGKKKDEKENQLKRTKSRELRGGIMYYSCHCIKRNGLQHDCRRTGCGGEAACLTMPDPVCAPSQLARARGLADPAALEAHLRAQDGGASASTGASDNGAPTGKRFIVCELKGIIPEQSTDKSGKCCKCPLKPVLPQDSTTPTANTCIVTDVTSKQATAQGVKSGTDEKCPCKRNPGGVSDRSPTMVFDEKMLNKILSSFDKKDLKGEEVMGPGGRVRKVSRTATKEETCTRPGCVHWKPPPPCVWDGPCKADCFETRPGVRPGPKPLTGAREERKTSLNSKQTILQSSLPKFKLLTPNYCAGCSASGTAASGGGPAPGLPMLVMKLC